MVLLGFVGAAAAAGYHFFKVEAVSGTADAETAQAGLGVSAFSDLVHGWITFAPPAAEGPIVREGWVESARWGPVIGVVPHDFDDLVDPYRNDLFLPWTRFRFGGEAATRRAFQADAAGYTVLNPLAFAHADPRTAYAGPAIGLGLEGTWWHDWKDTPGADVMTGKLTAQGGLVAGVTALDTWYGQAFGLGQFDLFGVHQKRFEAGATTGVYLGRVGVPLGIDLSAQWTVGDDNVHARVAQDWAAHATLFWKLAPSPRRPEADAWSEMLRALDE